MSTSDDIMRRLHAGETVSLRTVLECQDDDLRDRLQTDFPAARVFIDNITGRHTVNNPGSGRHLRIVCNGYSGYSYSGFVVLSVGEIVCPKCDGTGDGNYDEVDALKDDDDYEPINCDECDGAGHVSCPGCPGCDAK